MSTDVDIGNMALSRLGTRATIAALDENSTEARALNTHYTTVRDGLLRARNWGFARVTRALALSGTAPTRWLYSYALPSGCLNFLKIDDGFPADDIPDPSRISKEIGSDGSSSFLWTNQPEAVGIFTQRVTDPNRMDPLFVVAFVDGLAAAVAYPITQKTEVAARMESRAARSLDVASAANANEGSTNNWAEFEADAIRARS